MPSSESAIFKDVQSTWGTICYQWGAPVTSSDFWDLTQDVWDSSTQVWDQLSSTSYVLCPVDSTPLPPPLPSPTPLPTLGVGSLGSSTNMLNVLNKELENQDNEFLKKQKLKEVKNCSVTIILKNHFLTEEQSRFIKISKAFPTYGEGITNFPLRVLTETRNSYHKKVSVNNVKFKPKKPY